MLQSYDDRGSPMVYSFLPILAVLFLSGMFGHNRKYQGLQRYFWLCVEVFFIGVWIQKRSQFITMIAVYAIFCCIKRFVCLQVYNSLYTSD